MAEASESELAQLKRADSAAKSKQSQEQPVVSLIEFCQAKPTETAPIVKQIIQHLGKKQITKVDPDLMQLMVALSWEQPDSLVLRKMAEGAVRTMLLYGENWINTAQNLRTTGKKENAEKSITHQPSMPLDKLLIVKDKDLSSEPLMLEFQKCYAKDQMCEFAAVMALEETSTKNLKKLRREVDLLYAGDDTGWGNVKKLAAFKLTLTH